MIGVIKLYNNKLAASMETACLKVQKSIFILLFHAKHRKRMHRQIKHSNYYSGFTKLETFEVKGDLIHMFFRNQVCDLNQLSS